MDWDDCSVITHDDYHEDHVYQIKTLAIKDIEIKLCNKHGNDTKLDTNGNIVEDLCLTVNKIAIDGIDLIDKLSKISVYKDNSGKVYRTHNQISFSGSYRIKIHRNVLYTDWLASYL